MTPLLFRGALGERLGEPAQPCVVIFESARFDIAHAPFHAGLDIRALGYG
jgi:hypothetical protein